MYICFCNFFTEKIGYCIPSTLNLAKYGFNELSFNFLSISNDWVSQKISWFKSFIILIHKTKYIKALKKIRKTFQPFRIISPRRFISIQFLNGTENQLGWSWNIFNFTSLNLLISVTTDDLAEELPGRLSVEDPVSPPNSKVTCLR